jgi:hypothetical protein
VATFSQLIYADQHLPNTSALASDGHNIWVGNPGTTGTDPTVPTVTLLRESDGTLLDSSPDPGLVPVALAFDGASMWVANGSRNSAAKFRSTDHIVSQGSHTVGVSSGGANTNPSTPFHSPGGVAFDGSSIWVANTRDDTISKFPH